MRSARFFFPSTTLAAALKQTTTQPISYISLSASAAVATRSFTAAALHPLHHPSKNVATNGTSDDRAAHVPGVAAAVPPLQPPVPEVVTTITAISGTSAASAPATAASTATVQTSPAAVSAAAAPAVVSSGAKPLRRSKMAPAFRALLQQQQQQQQQRAKSASIIARDLSVASVPPVAGDKTTAVANGLPPFLPVLRRSRMAPRFRSAAL